VSGFTPRIWKSQAEPQTQRHADPALEQPPSHAHLNTNNLPIAATAFIGREGDVVDVKALSNQHRLVTLADGYERFLATLRATLREDEIALLSAEGATWSEDRAAEEALQVTSAESRR
jgi:hypothetical protein